MSSRIDKIVLHCSDSPHGRGDDAKAIHRWHVDPHKPGGPFHGIGYHWVITESGEIQAGRPEYWSGAHCRGNNRGSIGVCLIGLDDFTNDQVAALFSLRDELQERYPDAQWFNHYDLDSSKTCPNMDLVGLLDL